MSDCIRSPNYFVNFILIDLEQFSLLNPSQCCPSFLVVNVLAFTVVTEREVGATCQVHVA